MRLECECDTEIKDITERFSTLFGYSPTCVSRAPGRLEILGNHTDYNQGTVLSVAVNRSMKIAAAANHASEDGLLCRVHDICPRIYREFRLDELDAPPVKNDWLNYLKGVIIEMYNRGCKVPAFDIVMNSSVPSSAGMSSSAALEIALVMILDHLSDARLDWLEMAKIGQGCENNYIGANTGLMDQLSSLKGRANTLIHSDFRSFEIENVPLPSGIAFVVANSMVKHNLANEYNERRQACEEVAKLLNVPALRDISLAQLTAAQAQLPETSYRRALHVVGEIDRVATGRQALLAGDIAAFGRLMSESHLSSMNNFENSCPEIDRLIAIGQTLPGFIGARISGGGFGGISVHLVEAEEAESYRRALTNKYFEQTNLHSQTMICTAANGAELWTL